MFLPRQQDTTIITSFKNLRLRNLLTFGGEKAFVGAFNNIYHQTLAQQRCCDWAWDRSPDPWPSSIIIALQLPGPPPFYPQSCPIINTDTHGHTLGFGTGTEAQWRWHPTPGRRVSRSIKMFHPACWPDVSKSGFPFNVSASADAHSTGHIARDTRATHVRRGVKSAPAAATGARHVCRVLFPAIINNAW